MGHNPSVCTIYASEQFAQVEITPFGMGLALCCGLAQAFRGRFFFFGCQICRANQDDRESIEISNAASKAFSPNNIFPAFEQSKYNPTTGLLQSAGV